MALLLWLSQITLGEISMGQGQEPHARRLVTQAMAQGHWVLLQNGHLGLPFLNELMELLKSTQVCTAVPIPAVLKPFWLLRTLTATSECGWLRTPLTCSQLLSYKHPSRFATTRTGPELILSGHFRAASWTQGRPLQNLPMGHPGMDYSLVEMLTLLGTSRCCWQNTVATNPLRVCPVILLS